MLLSEVPLLNANFQTCRRHRCYYGRYVASSVRLSICMLKPLDD